LAFWRALTARENTLRTERSFGVFSRSFVLPATIDGSKPEARYVDGVLTVTLPKSEAARPRVIEVKDQRWQRDRSKPKSVERLRD
jgi:HSP20 family protein